MNFNISYYEPKFEEVSVAPGKTEVIIIFESNPKSMPFEITYILESSQVIIEKVLDDMTFFRNWKHSDEEIQNYLEELSEIILHASSSKEMLSILTFPSLVS